MADGEGGGATGDDGRPTGAGRRAASVEDRRRAASVEDRRRAASVEDRRRAADGPAADGGRIVLTDEVVALLDRAVLCWLSTVDRGGRPSVSPKEIFAVVPPDRLLIADIASPRSVRNVRSQAEVCVAAVDVFDQRGFQLYGRAELIEPDDARFTAAVAPLRAMAGVAFAVRRVISVTIDRIAPIVAPSYWALPDVDDETRRRGAYDAYGVRPA